jgi:glutathione S-transferase
MVTLHGTRDNAKAGPAHASALSPRAGSNPEEALMNEPIKFYTNPMSRGRIVHWMLEEVSAPYQVELLDFDNREHKSPAYLAINPMGKVPAIVHAGTVVTEAAAICAYLADAFPERKLAPAPTDPSRGAYYRWLFFGAGCIEPALIDRMFSRPPVERAGALGYGSYDDVIAALDQLLSRGPFALGQTFSAADVYLGSQLRWGFMTKAIEPRPSFQAYLSRLEQRPAYGRFMERTSELIEQLKARA